MASLPGSVTLYAVLPVFLAVIATAPPPTRLVFGGDLMLNRALPGPRVLGGVRNLFLSGDAAFANLEIPLTSAKGSTTRKSAQEIARKEQWILKAAPGHARYLWEGGIRAVSLGNNHCMDYGPEGLAEMAKALDRAGIVHAGAARDAGKAASVRVVCTPGGVRIGLLSAMAFMTARALRKTTPATMTSPGVGVLSFGGIVGPVAKKKLAAWIGSARAHCDFLVVGVHWGVERKTVPNAYQVALGRALADAGANVVWGHHPHVLQGAEMYRGVPILYSMGNLVSSLPGETGLVRLSLGRRRKVEFFPASIHSNQVTLMKGPAAVAARKRYVDLCRAIQAKYPNPQSCIPALN